MPTSRILIALMASSLLACTPTQTPGVTPAPSPSSPASPSPDGSPEPDVSPSPGASASPETPDDSCGDPSEISAFEQEGEGWTVVGDAQDGKAEPTREAEGGNPGAYMSANDDVTGGTWYWAAPERYLGDQSAAYGQTLSFDLKQSSTDNQFEESDVVILGAGLKLVLKLDRNPGLEWTAYEVMLNETADWKIDTLPGASASAAQIQQVLADVSQLWIRGEYVEGPDTGGIDNIRLSKAAPPACADQSVISRFETDYQGWRVAGDAQDGSSVPEFKAQGGNPDGHIQATDDVAGGTWYWDAPERYLGDQSRSYGKSLRFDLKQSILDNQFEESDVILEGDGLTLAFKLNAHPGTDWTAYQVMLNDSAGWKLNTLAGEAASAAQIQQVLSKLSKLWIRGEYVEGADIGGLDNVILER
ncbi:MAG: laminin B domain-containing protein [Candidatus Sericytochromatia bacterium]